MDLFYKAYGDGGPPFIILHGLLGASGNWHTLSRTRFSDVAHTFTVDQRNHGRSPHADRLDYPSMAADVHAFIHDREMQPAHVLGHSMGGKTAMQLALSSPDTVDRLVVADMAPKAYPPHHTDLLKALQRIDPSSYDDRSDIDAALAEDVPSKPIRQFLLKNLQYDGETYTWQMNLEAIVENYDRINEAVTADEPFEGPALFVRGERSDYVSDEDREPIRRLFPNAEFATIAGAGHWVHAEAPTAFADVVVDFLTA